MPLEEWLVEGNVLDPSRRIIASISMMRSIIRTDSGAAEVPERAQSAFERLSSGCLSHGKRSVRSSAGRPRGMSVTEFVQIPQLLAAELVHKRFINAISRASPSAASRECRPNAAGGNAFRHAAISGDLRARADVICPPCRSGRPSPRILQNRTAEIPTCATITQCLPIITLWPIERDYQSSFPRNDRIAQGPRSTALLAPISTNPG